jgi:hypothetical protein
MKAIEDACDREVLLEMTREICIAAASFMAAVVGAEESRPPGLNRTANIPR